MNVDEDFLSGCDVFAMICTRLTNSDVASSGAVENAFYMKSLYQIHTIHTRCRFLEVVSGIDANDV